MDLSFVDMSNMGGVCVYMYIYEGILAFMGELWKLLNPNEVQNDFWSKY